MLRRIEIITILPSPSHPANTSPGLVADTLAGPFAHPPLPLAHLLSYVDALPLSFLFGSLTIIIAGLLSIVLGRYRMLAHSPRCAGARDGLTFMMC